MVLYHATDYQNLDSILSEGLRTGHDSLVYFCERPDYAARFVYIRGIQHILVIEVDIPDEQIQESFDHNPNFFGCRAFTVARPIKVGEFRNLSHYDLRKDNKCC